MLAARIVGPVGGLLVLGGFVAPTRLGPIERAGMGFAQRISKITTPLLMGIPIFPGHRPDGLRHATVWEELFDGSRVGRQFLGVEGGRGYARGGMTHQF